jgi:pSer/pThr/pTyr-binding forkhead associated (FHA) protein
MDFLAWNTLLFALKWVLIGLIYFVLFLLLMAVRREVSLHIGQSQASAAIVPGRLKIINPGSDLKSRAGDIINLKPDTCFGSEINNDLVFKDKFISRHHARIEWDGANWWVEDLGSRNGTFINLIRCTPKTRQLFPVGSHLQAGDMIFELID